MMTLSSYAELREILGHAFMRRYKRRDANVVGLLFARPQAPFARDNIVPHIDYWHWRSDNFTDFFCPGYFPAVGPPSSDVVTMVHGRAWCFSNELFASFLRELEDRTSWRHSGGSELLIVNARAEYSDGRVSADLDFTSAIAVDLELAQRQEAIRDPSAICENLFEFAKTINEAEDDPVWQFSDRLGANVLRKSLREFLLSLLPKSLRPEARKAFYFVASDVSNGQLVGP